MKVIFNRCFSKDAFAEAGPVYAALDCAWIVGAIVNRKLIGMNMAVAERIGESLNRRIFAHGLDRASRFI